MKTLLFCTAYAGAPDQWALRYRKWLDFFSASKLARDQILLIDDGSPVMPSWRGTRILEDLPEKQPREASVIFHFHDNLGRAAVLDYPGWFRSFFFAAQYAQRYGFDKIVHVESDCYLYSQRIVEFINALSTGWTTFWCPRWGFPETCIQVICADQMERFRAIGNRNYKDELSNQQIEFLLPFTDVRKDFVGDRYGEYLAWVPEEADYASQIPDSWPV